MKNTVSTFKALSDSGRIRIVFTIIDQGEVCSCVLSSLLGLSPPTISRHTSVLLHAGLLNCRKNGKWKYFSISEKFPQELLSYLNFSLGKSRQIANDRKSMRNITKNKPYLCHQ